MKTDLLLVLVLLALVVFASVVFWVRWPAGKDQQSQALFTFLQFSATVFLLVVTALYARAAWAMVESQNKAPEISIPDPPTVPEMPSSAGAEFCVQFRALIANPSIRATSVKLERVEINAVTARNATLAYDGKSMKEAVTITGGGLAETTISATFTEMSVFPARKLKILFVDVFRKKSLPIEVHW